MVQSKCIFHSTPVPVPRENRIERERFPKYLVPTIVLSTCQKKKKEPPSGIQFVIHGRMLAYFSTRVSLANGFNTGSDSVGDIVRPKSTPPVKSASLNFPPNGTDPLYRPRIRFSIDAGVGSQGIVDPLSQYAMHSCRHPFEFRTEYSLGVQLSLVKVTICTHLACGEYANKCPPLQAHRRSSYLVQCTQCRRPELELTPSLSHQPRQL